jgi:muramoyltetrapeptide carboxypeptidase
MLHPERLQSGDMVGIIAPAGPVDMDKLRKGMCQLEKMGLRVQLGRNIHRRRGYLAGTDEERLADFHEMINDPAIKAIIFARGGYGTGRLAAMVDYVAIENNPKIIWGYSDITYLHTAIRQRTDLITFHGPMVASDMGKDDFDERSAAMLKQLFTPTGIVYSCDISPLNIHAPGEAAGTLVGGNLSVLVSTIGTPFEIDVQDKILLIEDVGEEPYRVDSMLNQLRLTGKLTQAAGIVVGDFANPNTRINFARTIRQVFDDYFHRLPCPVISGFKMGHCLPNIGVPLGAEAVLSSKRKTLVIQPGVK